MNKPRRARIQKVLASLHELKAELEAIEAEEQDYCDNIPEPFIDKQDKAQTAIDCINTTTSNVDDAISELEAMDS